MRLLQILDDGELSLVEHIGRHIPRYAVLSHTWGMDGDEVTFKDLTEDASRSKSKAGYRKLDFCRKQTSEDRLEFFWVDTCCIDKSSSAELSEAINSMFRWYQNAAKCYVYLSDVSVSGSIRDNPDSSPTWHQAFRNSRWFTRGWTLQELVGPREVDFFSAEGERFGNKTSLEQVIHGITKIPIRVLHGCALDEVTIQERMSWAKGRETKREEDAVYSLLGIFDIYMPLIYGEGRNRAFVRLQKEIQESLRGESPSYLPKPSTEEPKHKHNPVLTVFPGTTFDSTKVLSVKKQDGKRVQVQKGAMSATPMWPGNVIRTKFCGKYLQDRDSMSKAAYFGRWNQVSQLLDIAKDEHGENWANVVRLRHTHEASEISFWTLLHQAAYQRAPINVIKNLIENGSLSKEHFELKTQTKNHRNLTAAEIALGMGYFYLTDILAPVIHHTVPHPILARLQALFHEMIRADWKEVSDVVLPELVTLTELRLPEMWFPMGLQSED